MVAKIKGLPNLVKFPPLVGIAAALSSFCYVELASHCLSARSVHHYSYICVGEGLAWITGWAEYTIGGSTVARGAVTALCSTLMAHSCLRYPIKEHNSGTVAATLAFVRDVKQFAGMIPVLSLEELRDMPELVQ
ncbi:hypothetical protein Tco_1031659 [Tanacetum coccineum]|uniref:Uncharacterized protein n=1 Tax=Tanacetum coccineum TaxID=301880 RepID=A0ABQ5G9M7_9ASTR